MECQRLLSILVSGEVVGFLLVGGGGGRGTPRINCELTGDDDKTRTMNECGGKERAGSEEVERSKDSRQTDRDFWPATPAAALRLSPEFEDFGVYVMCLWTEYATTDSRGF